MKSSFQTRYSPDRTAEKKRQRRGAAEFAGNPEIARNDGAAAREEPSVPARSPNREHESGIRGLLATSFAPIPPRAWKLEATLRGIRMDHRWRSEETDGEFVLRMTWQRGRRELWIDQLQLPAALRRRGIGRVMVGRVMRLGKALAVDFVQAMPLQAAMEFWLKVGFEEHPTRSRVLRRSCTGGSRPRAWSSSRSPVD